VSREAHLREPGEPRNLLAEYQACQLHIQLVDMRLWQSGAILIGASFATLAVLSREEPSTGFCIGLSIATLAALMIFLLWTYLWRRRDAAISALQTRMQEIEWQTDMRRVIYFQVLTHWNKRSEMEAWQRLSPAERTVLETSYRPFPGPEATLMLAVTAMIALAGWPVLLLAKMVELAVD
jgi:hypothetical protein